MKFNNIKIIISIPHGRSGSVLMQSLFDTHPEVISFPSNYDFLNIKLFDLNTLDTFIVHHKPFFFPVKGIYLCLEIIKKDILDIQEKKLLKSITRVSKKMQ